MENLEGDDGLEELTCCRGEGEETARTGNWSREGVSGTICVTSKFFELSFRDNLLIPSKFFEELCKQLVGEFFWDKTEYRPDLHTLCWLNWANISAFSFPMIPEWAFTLRIEKVGAEKCVSTIKTVSFQSGDF